jgi:hypothetical protein
MIAEKKPVRGRKRMKLLEKKTFSTDDAIGTAIGFGIGWFGGGFVSGFVGQGAWVGAIGLAVVLWLLHYGTWAIGALIGGLALFLSGKTSSTQSGGITVI